MTTLTIASKANQATTLPALLVASFANESNPNVSITFKFEEAEILESSNSAVELIIGNGAPINGFQNCLDKLAQEYPFLSEKQDDRVGSDSCRSDDQNLHLSAGQGMDRSINCPGPDRLQGDRRTSPRVRRTPHTSFPYRRIHPHSRGFMCLGINSRE